jgi:hypothetical protein
MNTLSELVTDFYEESIFKNVQSLEKCLNNIGD